MSLPALHLEFFKLLHRAKRLRMDRLFADVADISRAEFFLLEVLEQFAAREPELLGMYASDLAGTLHVSPPAVSRMLRRLETQGLIARDVDAEDRRNTYVRITDRGREARELMRARMEGFLRAVFSEMGEERVRGLLKQGAALLEIMERTLAR